MVQQSKIQNQLVGRILIFPSPCSWGCSHILGNPDGPSCWCETVLGWSLLQSIGMGAWAAAEVCHCVKEAGLVPPIWAPVSPVFHLHWAWMWLKGFPSLELAAGNLQGCAGKVQVSFTDGPEQLESKKKWAQTTKLPCWTQRTISLFKSGLKYICDYCLEFAGSSLLMVFFLKWENLLKCIWALHWSGLILAVMEAVAQLQGRSFWLWQKEGSFGNIPFFLPAHSQSWRRIIA